MRRSSLASVVLFAGLFGLLPAMAAAQLDGPLPEPPVEGEGEGEAEGEEVPPPPGRGLDPATTTFPGGYQLQTLQPSDRVDVGGGQPLSLGQVLSSVVRHHPYLEGARQDVQAAAGQRLAAEGGFDLNLYARGAATPVGYYDWARADIRLDQATPLWGARFYAGWRIGRGGDIPSYYGNYETLDLGEIRAGVVVPLWRDGPIDSRRSRLWQAEHYEDAQEASLQARILRMRLDATAYYFRWVAAGMKYQVYAGLLDLAEQRDVQIATRVRAGAIPPIESLENRRVIVARRTTLIAARRLLERYAIALSLYYRTDAGAPRVPRPPRVPTDMESPRVAPGPLRQEVRAAWGRRPEMDRYRALIERQQVDVDYYENRFAPRIDVGFQASTDLGAGNGDAATGSDQQTTLGPAVVEGSILVSMPFQFREARGGIQYSRAQLAGLRADAQYARETIATQVQDAHSALVAAQERLALATEAAEVAEAVAEAERRRFELGATQLFIVNLREQSAASARATQIDAEASLMVAIGQWYAATGQTP